MRRPALFRKSPLLAAGLFAMLALPATAQQASQAPASSPLQSPAPSSSLPGESSTSHASSLFETPAQSTVAASTPANSPAQLDPLIDRVLANSNAQINRRELEDAMIDSVSRPLFKRLRNDPAWTPENTGWERLIPEFRQELARLTTPDDAHSRERLKQAMETRLNAAELNEIVAVVENPGLAPAREKMRTLGLDIATAARAGDLHRVPDLYSNAEKADITDRLLPLMTGRQVELEASMPDLAPVIKALNSPAHLKYQRLVADLARAAALNSGNDPAASERMQAFVARWREKVRD